MAHLSAHNLAKSYKSTRVIEDVSLEVEAGQIVGLLGPNGAGKTTCFYMIVGLVAADAHRLRAVQFDLRQVFQGDLQQRQIGFRVGAHHPRRGVPAVAQGHQDLIGVADHMVAGQHIAFGGHQHPGAQAGQGALAARALHEAVEQRVVAELLAAAGDDLGGIDVDHRRRRPGHRVRVAVRAGRRGGGRRAGVAGAGPVLVPPQHRQAHGQAGDHRQRQKSKQF